jgi:diacylglycerol O-acyltransferase / wax synthase
LAAPFDYRLRQPGVEGGVAGERELGVLVSRLQSRPLDLDRPLWEAHLIEALNPVRFAFHFKVLHHALMDGVGGSRGLQQMLSPDPTESGIRPMWAIGPSRSPDAPVANRSLIGRLGSVAGGVREGSKRWAASGWPPAI